MFIARCYVVDCAGVQESHEVIERLEKAVTLGGVLTCDVIAGVLEVECSLEDGGGVLKWFLDNGADLSKLDFERAGFLWHSVLCEDAAGGDLDGVLKQLTSSKLPWHPFALTAVIEYAPDKELLEIARWMIKEGCPVSGRAMFAACSLTNEKFEQATLALMDFLDEEGGRHAWSNFTITSDNQDYPCDDDRHWAVSFCGDAAIDSGSIAKFEWILERAPHCWLPVSRLVLLSQEVGSRK